MDITVEPTTPDPRIDLIQPDNGPMDQIITLFGANFGNDKGTVHFVDPVTGDKLGIVPEPAQCSALGGLWRDKQIVVKVPLGLTAGQNVPVYIERPDAKQSNKDKTYGVNTNPIAPGLYCLNPDNGPAGTTKVQIIGDKLRDNTTAQVKFYNDKLSSPVGTWTSTKIDDATVPVGAETGPVRVLVTTSGLQSNGLNFRVGACSSDSSCLAGEECCSSICRPTGTCAAPAIPAGSYRWRFSTGKVRQAPKVVEQFTCLLCAGGADDGKSCGKDADCTGGGTCSNSGGSIQSPSPWKDSKDACISSQVSVRFTTNLNPDPALVNNNTIKVFKCAPPPNDNNCTNAVPGGPPTIFDAGNNTQGISWTPASNFDPNTSYLVTIDPTLESSSDGALADGLPLGGTGYTWKYKT